MGGRLCIATAMLPVEIISLYRIFLRYSSASVLHARPAAPLLRRLYRPIFNEFLSRAKLSASSTSQRGMTEDDWDEFKCRSQLCFYASCRVSLSIRALSVQNTIDLFAASAQRATSPAHNLTKNLAQLSYIFDPLPVSKRADEINRMRRRRTKGLPLQSTELGMEMLSQVVALAEADQRVFLGRIQRRVPGWEERSS